MDDLIPKYSDEAQLNLAIFYGSYDEMMVYIEDVNGVNIYEAIFEKLEVQKVKVHPTEGKPNLINLYGKYKMNPSSFPNPCLFIADKDFDDILGKKLIVDQNFLYLERYSIENYLICEKAGSFYLNGRLQVGRTECVNKLSFSSWKREIEDNLKKILYLFLAIQKLQIPVVNTKLKVKRFLDEKTHQLDRRKISSYVNEVYKFYKQSGLTIGLKKTFKEMKICVEQGEFDFIFIYPGKQILEAFQMHLIKLTGGPLPNNMDFINFLATNINVNELNFIKERVTQLRSVS
ncbi:DUF4435 domain-containing protein [Paenibacillus physcomitrellae]|uniref:DUF4435 domain-containing protein n=1 Tax=Paenibacillus physcomitrellae TaxID=1619311 RepID=A0ABQ1FNK7_9BACL|nr:DUF4435 domain-containing protein [Paenibacillus physcomitrellae]GGA24138.1 hypothetical protein GCM10010917_06190 [Paenibacillus physcomitrellae]